MNPNYSRLPDMILLTSLTSVRKLRKDIEEINHESD